MSQARFEFGDSVRHRQRPEWGVGSVVKAEDVVINGAPSQRLNIRFANGGVKTLNSAVAELECVSPDNASMQNDTGDRMEALQRMGESDWLAPLAQKKIEETMTALPLDARDAFNGVRHRLEATLRLYRFDRSGHGLMDWAVAQSGLEDPLSRFSRPELEELFDRWTRGRDEHLRKLLLEARPENGLVDRLLADAPPAARQAAQRVAVLR